MTTTTMTSQQLSTEIDVLLEQYLSLLDTYTSLRAELSLSLSSIHQHIARANFSSPRGVRYDAGMYDERMQATRACRVSASAASPAGIEFAVRDVECDAESGEGAQPKSSTESEVDAEEEEAGEEEEQQKAGGEEGERAKHPSPVRMFGILIPPSLRVAQAESERAVGVLVPRLAQADAEMREVEVRIRRARKWMGRAEGRERGAAAAAAAGRAGEVET